MNELKFTGKISQIKQVRTGSTDKGEWANAEFEVTEQSDKYPQIALFDFFKNGEYVGQAKDFEKNYKVGDHVTVHFNLKKNTYTKKDGSQAAFYKTSAWKIEKGSSAPQPEHFQTVDAQVIQPGEEDDDLPF